MVTKNLGAYIKDKGITIARIAEATGISQQILYRSFDDSNSRQLNADEFLLICRFLDVLPYRFMDAAA